MTEVVTLIALWLLAAFVLVAILVNVVVLLVNKAIATALTTTVFAVLSVCCYTAGPVTCCDRH